MITSETPYKLAEIIRDTWPGLYMHPVKTYNQSKSSEKNVRLLGSNRKNNR
jgi:hypothetical protein